jgi:hypothetical protein
MRRMIRARLAWALGAGLAFAVGSVALAQGGPAVGPPVHPHPVVTAASGPAPTPVMPTPPPTVSPPNCTCGDRHGLSRWRWHRTQCRRAHQAKWIGFPEEFNEWQLGRSLYAHNNIQVANGAAARMVFYHYDFIDGTSELNLRGRDKLAAITPLLGTTFHPVVVERTPRAPGLDPTRRITILAQLAGGPFPVPGERVVIGPPIAGGLRGTDSFLIDRNRLGSVAAGGALGGTVGGAGTSVGATPLDSSGLTGSAVGGAGIR